MNKIIYSILLIVAVSILAASCNKTPTYAQRLDDEKRAIELFMSQKGYVVLDKYPANKVFKANEFFKDPVTGVFYNVIDSGGSKAFIGGEIYIRFRGLQYFSTTDTSTYSNMNAVLPETLVFGNSSTYLSTAWVVPLLNVGHLGRVKMVVPFNYGLNEDQSAYRPAYYDEIVYRMEELTTTTN